MERVYTYIDRAYDVTVGNAIRSVHQFLPFELPAFLMNGTLPPSVKEAEGEKSAPEPESFKTMSAILEERIASPTLARSIAYVGSTRVPVFRAPTKEFDTVLTTLSYGTMVMVLEEKGRFSHVMFNELHGWMLRDDLSDRAAFVYPEFTLGEENGADDPSTLRLRACISDEFGGGEAELPLQAGEYVLYKLLRKGKKIPWPPERPRTPGKWHVLLRGLPGVHIGIAPRTGSIMECTLEHDIGHVAYVEAVFPDERITVSEANYPDQGRYSERTLTKEEWQRLNPVFIEVNT